VHELQEVERKVMACSDWTLGARSGGFPVSCCSPELEGMAAALCPVPCGGRIADVVRVDLEGFWPSRRGDAFDEWCR